MSFGFARGLAAQRRLWFSTCDFLRNPHWVDDLRPQSGLDQPVADYIAADPAYADAIPKIEDLLLTLLPRYAAEGKSYVSVAIGCTGGRHRSVHVAPNAYRATGCVKAGFSPTITHRDLATRPDDLYGREAGRVERGCDALMIGLVLVTHGALATEFVTAMEHVVGKQRAIAAICIGPDDDMETRGAKISRRRSPRST